MAIVAGIEHYSTRALSDNKFYSSVGKSTTTEGKAIKLFVVYFIPANG